MLLVLQEVVAAPSAVILSVVAPAANNSLLHITRSKILNGAINLYDKVMAAKS